MILVSYIGFFSSLLCIVYGMILFVFLIIKLPLLNIYIREMLNVTKERDDFNIKVKNEFYRKEAEKRFKRI